MGLKRNHICGCTTQDITEYEADINVWRNRLAMVQEVVEYSYKSPIDLLEFRTKIEQCLAANVIPATNNLSEE